MSRKHNNKKSNNCQDFDNQTSSIDEHMLRLFELAVASDTLSVCECCNRLHDQNQNVFGTLLPSGKTARLVPALGGGLLELGERK